LLIDCDTCKKYYHVNCLDPPLSVVPKKTKLYGWECSKCVHLKDKSSSDFEEEETDYLSKSSRSRRDRKTKIFTNDIDLMIASVIANKKLNKRKSTGTIKDIPKKTNNSRKNKSLFEDILSENNSNSTKEVTSPSNE
jgi:hypothetical protein